MISFLLFFYFYKPPKGRRGKIKLLVFSLANYFLLLATFLSFSSTFFIPISNYSLLFFYDLRKGRLKLLATGISLPFPTLPHPRFPSPPLPSSLFFFSPLLFPSFSFPSPSFSFPFSISNHHSTSKTPRTMHVKSRNHQLSTQNYTSLLYSLFQMKVPPATQLPKLEICKLTPHSPPHTSLQLINHQDLLILIP